MGVELYVVAPSPSWPLSFLPQHFTPPAAVNAQVCESPVEMAVAEVKDATVDTVLLLFSLTDAVLATANEGEPTVDIASDVAMNQQTRWRMFTYFLL
jgi:hypothetical protein